MSTNRLLPGSGVLRVVAVLAAGLALPGCDTDGGKAPDNAAGGGDTPVLNIADAIPLPQPPIDRERLLLAVARAASAFATGADDREAQADLAGRRFSLRMRFGCRGPAEEPATRPMTWSYDEERERLQVRAAPDISIESQVVASIAGGEFESVEGFWVNRPWLLSDTCPLPRPAPAPAGEQEQATPAPARYEPSPSVGIAQFFSASDSRVQRRSRPYQALQQLAPEDMPTDGFTLVLSGRLKPLRDRRVILCASEDADARPTCIVSAEIDTVAIQNPRTGTVVADWGVR